MNSSQYLAWIEQSAAALSAAQDELTALDTAIGDGDHGLNIQRGFHKAVEKLHGQEGQDLGSLAKTTGMTLLSSVGKTDLDTATLAQAIADGVAGLAVRGQAVVGDKTMIDVWQPAAAALQQAAADGADLATASAKAAAVAQEAAESTIPLVAKKGRASYLGERSAGHKDPGAASSAIILHVLAEVLA